MVPRVTRQGYLPLPTSLFSVPAGSCQPLFNSPDDTQDYNMHQVNSTTERNTRPTNNSSNSSTISIRADPIARNHLLATQTVWLIREDIKVRFAEMGDPSKPTVLLLHGVPENLQAWYTVAPLLAEKYHVLALDWPGFGGSDPLSSSEEYTSRKYAELIIDFLDTLDIQQANLVATDIALLPALLAGLEHPSRILKLAVMDGIPFPRPQYSSWELRSFARKGSILGKALVRWFPQISAQIAYLKGFYRGHSIPAEIREEFAVDGVRESTQEAFLSYFQNFHMGQEYFEPRAHQLQKPVLVVWGKYDRFISSRLGSEIAKKLPNARLEIVDKSGHYIHMDKPQELAQLVIEFLGESGKPELVKPVTTNNYIREIAQ